MQKFTSKFLLFTLFMLGIVWNASSATITSSGSGNWSAGATWVGGSVPAAGDDVVIAAGHTIVLDASYNCRTLSNAGTLSISANTLTIEIAGQNNSNFTNTGTLNISGGTIILNGNYLQSAGSFLQSGGDIIIDGNANNVAANSVASATHLFNISATAVTVNCTAGTITIVDPPCSSYATSTTRAISVTQSVDATKMSGTHTFIIGDGVSSTVGNSDGFTIETYASGQFYLNNVIVNAGNATGRWACGSYGTSTVWGTYIKNLTINTGSEFRVNQTITSANNLILGNLTNNGTFTSGRSSGTPTFTLGTHSTAVFSPTSTTTVSGSGTFRNLATSPTASFANLTINNPNGVTFSGTTLALGSYGGNVSGTLTFTAGVVNTSGQIFVLGTATGTLGTLTYTAGGFAPGSTFGRWYAAATAGTTISASANPSIGTGSYPFMASTNTRHFHLNRPTTTGATGGVINVTYNDGSGLTSITPVTDAGYNIDNQSNANWVVGTSNGFAAGTGTFSYCINGQNIFVPINTNTRLIKNGTIVGIHQTGTTLPLVQRTTIAAADFQGTFNVGVSSTDIPLQSVQSGAWEDPATWGGTTPTCSSTCAIVSGHTISVSASTTAGVCNSIINSGTINVTGGSLTVGCTNNNASFTNNSVLTVSGGTLNINGNINNTSTSTFTQGGGDIIVNGNSGSAATSVATGTPIIQFQSNALTLNGGKLTIVTGHIGTATADRVISYTPSASPFPLVTTSHTTQFGDGTNTTANSTKGFEITTGTRFYFGNVIMNSVASANNFFASNTATLIINGDLTVTNGDFRCATSTQYIGGNITNNSTLTSTGTLYFGQVTQANMSTPTPSAATIAQTISGTGTFRNSTTASTANFTSLTINNTNTSGVSFSTANALLSGANTGTVSGTLTFTAGTINTNGLELVLGTSVSSVGTLSHTAGGFTSGSKMTRWIGTATGGTTITAATLPSFSGTGSFPFINASGAMRVAAIQQTAAATSGGKITIAYNASTGTATTTIVDGTYNIESRSNDSWAISQTGITGSSTYTIAICAQNLYVPSNGNSRVCLAAAPALGTHQNGTTYPLAQRTVVPLANLSDTYYIGIANSDIPFQSLTSGNWEDGSTWNKGVAPSCTDAVNILNGHTVTVNAAAGNCNSVTIATGGTLVVSGSTLTTGCTVNNSAFTVNGTLTVSGGTLNVNGNVLINAGATFNQSAGDIIVDGNANGNTTNSVASGTVLFSLRSALGSVTGGNLTLVDPPASGTARSLEINLSSGQIQWGAGHTTYFGNGVSTDVTTNTSGFQFDTYVGTFSTHSMLGSVVVNGGSAINRWTTTTSNSANGSYIKGNLTINSGSELRDVSSGGNLVISGNITNNGTMTMSTVSLVLATYTGSTQTAATNAQTISGSGVFRNATSSPTANFVNITVNNTNAAGVTFANNTQISGTLTQTAGIINMGTNTLTIGISTTTAGTWTYTAGRVIGKVAKWFSASPGTTNITFPVGDATTQRNAIVKFNSTTITTGGTLAVEFKNTDLGETGLPTTLSAQNIFNVSPSGYWTIDAGNGLALGATTYNATFDMTGFTKRGGDAITSGDLADLRIVKRTSGSGTWVGGVASSAGPSNLNAVAIASQTSFSEFGLGSVTAVALPVELVSFTGTTRGNANVIAWEAAVEQNVKHYTLEKSVDANVWTAVEVVKTNKAKSYTSIDNKPFANTYYRLKITNTDESTQYSKVISIRRAGRAFEVLQVSPNPTMNDLNLTIENQNQQSVTIEIIDMNGRMINSQTNDLTKGINQITLPMSNLNAGVYYIYTRTSNEVSVHKVIKQ